MKAIFAILFIAAFLVACETQTGAVTENSIETPTAPTTVQDVVEVNMKMGNWYVEPREIKAKQGDLVRVNIQVEDGTHSLGIQGYTVNSGPLGAGESKTVEFTADKVGTFQFFCNVPCGTGHKDMRGQLIVE